MPETRQVASLAGTDSTRRVAALVRPSQIGFAIVAWLFAVCVVIQIYLAGMGVFAGAHGGDHAEHGGWKRWTGR